MTCPRCTELELNQAALSDRLAQYEMLANERERELREGREREEKLREALVATCFALGGCITSPPCGGCAWCNARALLDKPEKEEGR
jgi:hypothetical protein